MKVPYRQLPFAAASGLLLFLSFPGAAGLWPLAWIALVPLLLATHQLQPRAAAGLGFLTGFVHHITLLPWILIVLGRYGGLPVTLAVPALVLLAAYMSLYLSVFTAIISYLKHRGRPLIWTAPLAWVALDWIRAWAFSGFPWQDIAYSQFSAPLMIQAADLAGHHGVSFLIVLCNSLIAAGIIQWREKTVNPRFFLSCSMAAVLLISAFCYGFVRRETIAAALPMRDTATVGVIQGNVEQDLKWSPAMQQETVRIYSDLTLSLLQAPVRPQIILWPETALPFYPSRTPLLQQKVADLVSDNGFWLLTGSPTLEADLRLAAARGNPVRYFNSALLVAPSGMLMDRYDKQHLVPFGEYVPLRGLLPIPRPLVESIGDYSAGSPGAPLRADTMAMGVLICFESIFPELARKHVLAGANLLVNLTNDAWFGRSAAPWQHLSMAVFRAVENRRSLVRAANTGISCFIDPTGRISHPSPLFQPFAASGVMPLLTERTVYTDLGHHFPGLCLAFLCVALMLRQKRGPAGKHVEQVD